MRLHVPDFRSAQVLVVGDVMLDRYWHGTTSRISPEAPVPVVRVEQIEERPGGAANVAVNLAALGANAHVIGVVGQDEAAARLTQLLERRSVQHHLLSQAEQPTITKLRVLSRHQQLLRVDFEDGFPQLDADAVLTATHEYLANIGVLVLSDYAKGALRNPQALISAARALGKPVLVDPKGRDFNRYRHATLLTPNLSELEAVVGPCPDNDTLVSKGQALLHSLDLQALLITRSEHGMTLLQRNGEPLHLPARAREVFDVTGAGDTVIATLAGAIAAGLSLSEATALANLAAGLVVAKLGTASVTASELQRALYSGEELERGILSEDDLVRIIELAKAHGETIVMTNGCFDILHAGHVTYLEQAKRLGSRLIVAVNDDASVRRLKGETRPVNTLERRMRVLAGLSAVDWVVPFYEDTPERLICRIKPDYLVKGGDNDPQKIPGNQCVWDAGGQVVVMDYIDGCSTTGTIARILQRN